MESTYGNRAPTLQTSFLIALPLSLKYAKSLSKICLLRHWYLTSQNPWKENAFLSFNSSSSPRKVSYATTSGIRFRNSSTTRRCRSWKPHLYLPRWFTCQLCGVSIRSLFQRKDVNSASLRRTLFSITIDLQHAIHETEEDLLEKRYRTTLHHHPWGPEDRFVTTVIFEVRFSEAYDDLRPDACQWLERTKGEVQAVVFIHLQEDTSGSSVQVSDRSRKRPSLRQGSPKVAPSFRWLPGSSRPCPKCSN